MESVQGCQFCYTYRQDTFGFLPEKMVYAFPESGLQIGHGQQRRVKNQQAVACKAEKHRLYTCIGLDFRHKSQCVQRLSGFYYRNSFHTFLQTLLFGFYFFCVFRHKLFGSPQPHPCGYRHADLRRADADTQQTDTRIVYVFHIFHRCKDSESERKSENLFSAFTERSLPWASAKSRHSNQKDSTSVSFSFFCITFAD